MGQVAIKAQINECLALHSAATSAIRDELHRRDLGILEFTAFEAELVDLAVAWVRYRGVAVDQAATLVLDAIEVLREEGASWNKR